MPLPNVKQPEILEIDHTLRLKRADHDDYRVALRWYQDREVISFSEGLGTEPYDESVVQKMYEYLAGNGELYFIEVFEKDWCAIGDVTLKEDDLPIVIGEIKYWGRGIGKRVVEKLLERAKEIGISKFKIKIYKHNERSRRLFLSKGFAKVGESDIEDYFELDLAI